MNRYRQIIESATEFAIVATDRDGVVTEWNTGAERTLGWTAREIIGRDVEIICTPEDRERGQIRREMAESLDHGRGLDERWHMRKDGSRFWASGEMMPLRSDADEHVGFVKILRDRTDQHLAGLRLEELALQLRQAQEAGGVGLFTLDIPTATLSATEELSRLYGYEHRDVRPARDFEALVLPEDRTLASSDATRKAGDAQRAVVYRIRRADTGELRRIERKGEFRYDENGVPVRFVGIARDVTEKVEAEMALRESEERLRLAVEVGDVGVFDLSLQSGEPAWDVGARAAFAVRSGRDAERETKPEVVHPDDRTAFGAAFAAAMNGEPFDLAFRTLVLDDRKVRWIAVQGRIVENAHGGRNFIGAARDISESVAAEEQRATLNAELAHRLKNTLALVSSIVTQTLRTAPDVGAARKTLTDRIQALSKAHDILLTGRRDAASIREIVRTATALHDEGGRVDMEGPDISLGPKASLALSLILHELATNAAKYGALSVPEGRVLVAWSVALGDGVSLLVFEWREAGGPPVTPPARRSFGTRLIEMGFSTATQGAATIDYAPDGLVCRLVGPLPELQAAEDA